LKKEKSLCRRMVKDKGEVGEGPVREEERVAVADPRIASAPIAASERRIHRVNHAMSRNAQNAGELCEESELAAVFRVPLTVSAVTSIRRTIRECGRVCSQPAPIPQSQQAAPRSQFHVDTLRLTNSASSTPLMRSTFRF